MFFPAAIVRATSEKTRTDSSPVLFSYLMDLILLKQHALLESSVQVQPTSDLFLQRNQVPPLRKKKELFESHLKANSLATRFCTTQPFVAKLKPHRSCLPPSGLHQTYAPCIWQLRYESIVGFIWKITQSWLCVLFQQGETALHLAVWAGSPRIVKMLLDVDIDINTQDNVSSRYDQLNRISKQHAYLCFI